MSTEVTVVIPTFNGERYLDEVLTSVRNQDTDFDFEVLVIDSGSSDATLDIVRSHPVRLVEIPNEEFGHGRTRNLAADMATGSYVAFITQDATPASRHWLQSYVSVLHSDDRIAAAYGPHLPRPDADPKTKKDLSEFFVSMSPDGGVVLQRAGDITFFSDVNGCIRKSVWEQIRYRDLDYAEDQAFGKEVLEAGYLKAFVPDAAVVHSHTYGVRDYFRRQYDEWLGLERSIGVREERSLARLIGGAVRDSWLDARHIARDRSLASTQRIRAIYIAATMNLSRRLAPYLATRESKLPSSLRRSLSYERSWKHRIGRQQRSRRAA